MWVINTVAWHYHTQYIRIIRFWPTLHIYLPDPGCMACYWTALVANMPNGHKPVPRYERKLFQATPHTP